MGRKRKRRNHRSQRSSGAQAERLDFVSRQSFVSRWRARTVGAVVVLAGLAGALSDVLGLSPDVKIEAARFLNSTEPLGVAIVVANDWGFSISDMRVDCFVDALRFRGQASPIAIGNPFARDNIVPYLGPGASTTVPCDYKSLVVASQPPIEEMTLSVQVEYDANKWIPGHSRAETTFHTLPSRDGELQLFPVPPPKVTPRQRFLRLPGR